MQTYIIKYPPVAERPDIHALVAFSDRIKAERALVRFMYNTYTRCTDLKGDRYGKIIVGYNSDLEPAKAYVIATQLDPTSL